MRTIAAIVKDLDTRALDAWASGSSGPCPVFGEAVLEGDDCAEAHYSKAIDFAQGNTARLPKAVATLRARREAGIE